MRYPLRLALFTLLAYGLFLAVQLPARLLVERWTPPAGWQLSEPRGSVWHGTIATIRHQGRSLGGVRWRLIAWRLLLGDLAVDWTLEGPHGTAQGELRWDMGDGRPALHDVTLDLAPAMASALGWSPVVLGGRVSGRLERLAWQAEEGLRATGMLQWRDATLQIGETLSLGSVVLRSGAQGDEDIVIEGDGEGDVRLDGRLQWLSSDRYDLLLTLQPLNAVGQRLADRLGSAGSVTREGAVQFRHKGIVPSP